jgi:hypothetical protein
MNKEEELLKRRANCRIWVHLILWLLFLPLGGGLVSIYKMRFMTPVYVMLAGFCFWMACDHKIEFMRFFRFIVHIIGCILTICEIRKSRKALSILSTRNQFL